MSEASHPHVTSQLLTQHIGWMRALAQSLVRDPDTADDVVQDALVRALERAPGDPGRLRGWLAAVVRSASFESHRTSANRRGREAWHAEDRAGDSEALLENFHTGQRLAAVLVALEEPYRTALLLRYFEGLAPRAIARRTEEPVATIKSRLHRGLALLRERLDGEYGDRRAWIVAMLPLAKPKLAAAGASGVATALGIPAAVAAAIAVAVLLVGTLWPDEDDARALALRPEPGAAAVADDDDRADTRAPDTLARAEAAGERSSVVIEVPVDEAPTAAPAAGSPPPAAPAREVVGRLLHVDGRALAGVEVGDDGGRRARSDFEGRFRLLTPEREGRLEVTEPGLVTVRAGSWRGDPSIEPVVVAANRVVVLGRVEDEWGRPLKGADVSLVVPAGFEARFDTVLDASLLREWRRVSDEAGAFAFEHLPAIGGADLLVSHPAYGSTRIPAPEVDNPELIVRLMPRTIPAESALRGRVVHADGAPAPGAWVSTGAATVRADDRGEFALDLRRSLEADELRAVLPGFRPGVLTRADASAGLDDWPSLVVVRLGAPTLTIEGRVLDNDGEPVQGARVWVGDPTTFGVLGTTPLRAEALGAGAAVSNSAIDSLAELPEKDGKGRFGSARPQLAPDALLWYVLTGPDGAFELEGLADRDYELHILGPDLSFGWIERGVAAGSRGLSLRAPATAAVGRWSGRVIDQTGEPVAGVALTPWIPAVNDERRVFGGVSSTMRFFLARTGTSSEDGSFSFGPVPRKYTQLHLISDEILPGYASIEDASDPLSHDIRVVRRAHLQVDVSGSGTAVDAIRVRDASGKKLDLYLMRADGYSNLGEIALEDGRSGVVTVPSHATELLLYHGGAVVETIPLYLVPGEVTRIRR